MKVEFSHKFEDIVSIENLLAAWQEFVRGKRGKSDIQEYKLNLYDNILHLHNELVQKTYHHGGYYNFKISDPKPREISKASVRDRLVHHAVHRVLYKPFDQTFIYDSYSCRVNKGTHKAIKKLQSIFLEVSNLNSRTCWALKLDIRKFFANIDHDILIKILEKYISDPSINDLLREIIKSFPRGLPLGNLTSQLFVNVYMNEFDQFIKNNLKINYYIRYADDFVILSRSRLDLENLIPKVESFLDTNLKLQLHPNKIILKTFASGIDFLGWVHFADHRVLRTTTRRRISRRIKENPKEETYQSYLGMLRSGNTYKITESLTNNYWLFKNS